MKMIVDPDRIEELGRQLKNFSLDVEGMYRYVHDMVTKLVDAVDAKYHESYVRANTRALREALGTLRGNTETASRNLQDLSRYALESAQEYRARDSQLARLIAQSSIKFGLNFDMQKALSGIYRVTGVSTSIGSKFAVRNLNIKLGTGSVTALLAGGSIPVLTTGAAVVDMQKVGKKQQEAMAKLDEIIRVERKIAAGEIYPTYHIAKLLSEKNSVIEALLKYEENAEMKKTLMMVKNGDPAAWGKYITQKVQYYLHEVGFDIGTDKNGNPLLDGLFGPRTASAVILMQYYLDGENVNGRADDLKTLELIRNAAMQGVTFKDIKEYMSQWKPESPSYAVSEKDNGYIPVEHLARISTMNGGYDLIQKEVAVAWAKLIQDVLEYNKTAKDEDKLKLSAFTCSDGYRPYVDQVRLYAGYYLEDVAKLLGTSNYNIAATPKFNIGVKNAHEYIKQHVNEFKKDPYKFAENAVSSGILSGYGTSNHGYGLAIDFNFGDPGSLFYRILDKDHEYNGYIYKKGQIVGHGQTEGPPIDPLTAYQKFSGKGYSYGMGKALKKETRWLAAQDPQKTYGFKPLLVNKPISEDEGNFENNYKETWHWSYAP